jgi:hypothetical protein
MTANCAVFRALQKYFIAYIPHFLRTRYYEIICETMFHSYLCCEMERVVREAERTGRAAVEQAYVQRLPKNLTEGPAAAKLRHLKLWYCMLPDDALPPLGHATASPALQTTIATTTYDDKEASGLLQPPDEGLAALARPDEARRPLVPRPSPAWCARERTSRASA